VIPGEARDKPVRGVVVAVGPGLLLQDGGRGPMDVGEGDRVVFGAYGGTDVEVEGETLTVMRESEVLFVE
jgi:chaperonin GroES